MGNKGGGGRGGRSGGAGGGGGHRGGSRPEYSPNDDRSVVKNPTSPEYEADRVNRDKQAERS